MELHRVQLLAELRELLLGVPGYREVHVVAAQKQVLADGDALELQLARFLRNRNQRQVRGPAPDVDNQDQIAGFDSLPPIWIAVNPGVERRLRFFEDRDLGIPGGFCGALRQLAGRGIE